MIYLVGGRGFGVLRSPGAASRGFGVPQPRPPFASFLMVILYGYLLSTRKDLIMAHLVRIAAVSLIPPAHDHHDKGVDLTGLRDIVKRVMKDKPTSFAFPKSAPASGRCWQKV